MDALVSLASIAGPVVTYYGTMNELSCVTVLLIHLISAFYPSLQ